MAHGQGYDREAVSVAMGLVIVDSSQNDLRGNFNLGGGWAKVDVRKANQCPLLRRQPIDQPLTAQIIQRILCVRVSLIIALLYTPGLEWAESRV